jgi:hypothetical protein
MPKSIFDHANAIYTDQSPTYFDTLDDTDKKTLMTFMINRILSMNPSQIELVNEAQKYGLMDPRSTYLFFSNILPKGKQYNKYVKGKKDDKYESWLIELVAKNFSISKSEAIDALEVYYHSEAGKAELRMICEGYGVETKLITKVKL